MVKTYLACREQQKDYASCQATSHSRGALAARTYRDNKMARIADTESELVRSKLAHSATQRELDSVKKDKLKLHERLAKLQVDNARLRTAVGRENFLRETQTQLKEAMAQVEALRGELKDLAESTKETAELCQAYVPVARAAKTRQVASYSLGMKILHFSNGHVLDDNGQRVAVPLSAYDDGRDISTVNGNIDLFVETETKRKTASCRGSHAEVFRNGHRRQLAKMMTAQQATDEASEFVHRVAEVAGRSGVCSVRTYVPPLAGWCGGNKFLKCFQKWV
jgi:hypothetical protein